MIVKIVKFTAENVKKLRAVEITPDGTLVEVTGPNGSGKSSVLDAIYYALAGTAGIPGQVVRTGEDRAHVRLDLGEIVVTRRFSKDGGTTLVVEAASGARFPSPQRMLDDLVGSLSFDPLEFARSEPKIQLERLKALVPVPEADQLAREIAKAEQERLELHREREKVKAQGRSFPEGLLKEELPAEPVDVKGLLDEINRVTEENSRAAALSNENSIKQRDIQMKISTVTSAYNIDVSNCEHGVRTAANHRASAEVCREQATELLRKAESHEKTAIEIETTANDVRATAQKVFESLSADLSAQLNNLRSKAFPRLIDTGDLRRQVEEAGAVNKKVEQRGELLALHERYKALRIQVEDLDAGIEKMRATRREAIAAAPMPIPGLALGEEGVVYHGLPLENASSSEQLRISVAIAMAANPRLRVLRVKDGSLLDAAGMRELAGMAAEADYQVWVETVEGGKGRACVLMEDGEVSQ